MASNIPVSRSNRGPRHYRGDRPGIDQTAGDKLAQRFAHTACATR